MILVGLYILNHEACKYKFLRGLGGLRGSIFNPVTDSLKSNVWR